MAAVNLRRLFFAAVATFVAFIAAEFVVEGLAYLLFNVRETDIWNERPDVVLSGVRFHIVNLSTFFAICIVIMSVYALIRPSFDSTGITVVATTALVLLMEFLLMGNFANMGVFTVEMLALSLIFNLIETPFAVLVGARVYDAGNLALLQPKNSREARIVT